MFTHRLKLYIFDNMPLSNTMGIIFKFIFIVFLGQLYLSHYPVKYKFKCKGKEMNIGSNTDFLFTEIQTTMYESFNTAL